MRAHVTVTVADSHAGAVGEVAGRLRAAGMDVTQVRATIGMITGSVEDSQLAALAALPGVAAVEPQAGVQIAPPDADVQ